MAMESSGNLTTLKFELKMDQKILMNRYYSAAVESYKSIGGREFYIYKWGR